MALLATLAAAWPAIALARPASAVEAVSAFVDSAAAPLAIAMPAPSPAEATPRLGIEITGSHRKNEAPTHRLPFADHPAPITYPEYSLSVGYAGFHSEFQGVMEGFRSAESAIQQSTGFTVPGADQVDTQGTMLYSFDVSLNRLLDVSLQYAATGSDRDDVKFAGGLVWGRYSPPGADGFSLLAGIGGGYCKFHFERRYDAQISPVDASGGYTTLDFIQFEGASGYWTVAGRAEYRVVGPIGVDGTIQYFGMPDVPASAGNPRPPAMNVSGTILGVALRLYF